DGVAHLRTGPLQRLQLRRRGAGVPRDDGARMAHPLSGRSGAAADEADDRLAEAAADHLLSGRFLVAAANLADHHHRPGGRIVLEEPQDIAEGEAEDRIAADPDRRGLPDTGLAD